MEHFTERSALRRYIDVTDLLDHARFHGAKARRIALLKRAIAMLKKEAWDQRYQDVRDVLQHALA